MQIVIGTHFYSGNADSARQQERARAALLALSDVHPTNVQFADETIHPAGFDTLAVLTRDSRTVTGEAGVRKPIVSDIFDALAETARTRGCRYFAYLNADIEVTQAALERVRTGGRDGYAFCRVDVHPATRAATKIERYGLDMFAIDAAWWRRERRRFRSYIAGEPCWDNVFAAIVCAHGNGEIVDEAPGILHEQHERAWGGSVFAHYNGYLAALDAGYFSQWVAYTTRRDQAEAAGQRVDRRALIAEVFSGEPRTPVQLARHAARSLRARWQYAARARSMRTAGGAR